MKISQEKNSLKYFLARTFPQIRIDGENIGGYQQLEEWHNTDWNEK